MPTGPRVVFMRFVSRDAKKLIPWRDHCRRVVGAGPRFVDGGFADDRSAVTWNLVSANNRMLARSATLFATLDGAIADAERLSATAGSLQSRLVADELRGQYGWYATSDSVPAITCARWYLTERDRRSALELAVVSLSAAVLLSEARLVDPALTGFS